MDERDQTPLTRSGLIDILDHRDRLTKNGETWRRYFRRLTNPTNIVVVAGFVYMAGAEIRQVRVDLASALARTEHSREVEDALSEANEEIQATLDRIVSDPGTVDRADLDEIRSELAALRQQMQLTPTRREVNEQWQAAMARLERIEAQHEQFMRGRGAGAGS